MIDFVGRTIHIGDRVVHFTTKHKCCVATRDVVVGMTDKRIVLKNAKGPVQPNNLVIYKPVEEE